MQSLCNSCAVVHIARVDSPPYTGSCTPSCAASSMAQSAFHLLDPSCPCMRCAWRTRHAAFWAALDTSAPGQFIMQKSSSDDDSNSGSDNEDVNSYLVPQFAGSASAAAARILNQAPAIQALIAPALQLRKPDIKHQAKFPFVTGGFDDDCVSVQWNSCNGQNICDIFTSKMFGSGRGAQKSMGVWARELMKHLKVQCRFHQSFPQRIEAVLEKVPKGTQGGQRSALQSDEFEPLLTEILAQSEFLPSARAFLVQHNANARSTTHRNKLRK